MACMKVNWLRLRPHGVGKMTYADGSVSTGIWKNGQIVYEGELLHGKPHERGKKVYSNGDVYEGDWKNGFRDGEGTLNFENGDVYTGEWRANKMQGKGTTFSRSIFLGVGIFPPRREFSLARREFSLYVKTL
eukprot:scaffold2306_cov82-Skeletonema_dohrnii-CCMP3373.AAC.1